MPIEILSTVQQNIEIAVIVKLNIGKSDNRNIGGRKTKMSPYTILYCTVYVFFLGRHLDISTAYVPTSHYSYGRYYYAQHFYALYFYDLYFYGLCYNVRFFF